MATDSTERGLERLICEVLTGDPCDPPPSGTVGEPSPGYGGVGWSPGSGRDYDREYCVDPVQLRAFLESTQPESAEALRLAEESPARRKFLARLQGEINKRGTIDVLRRGVRHGPHHLELFHGTPSAGNETARRLFESNRFTVVRQLRYSRDEKQRALDIALFINGLPVFTFELKNNLTKQTVDDAVRQYERDRNPREPLFRLGRCVAHFAVDESEVRFCTHLMKGKASWFLPFNRGWNHGAGNPPNPDGLKTEYLWRNVLARGSLTNILENYAQILTPKDARTGRRKRIQIWPRYQQLDVVRRLLAHAARHGVGKRYLIQHSAGSGKSFSIAWLAHQMIPLEKDGKTVFDSIIVVTDRRILDRQIRGTIKQYGQVKATVGHAERSGDLRQFIEHGKKIIVTTIQKFPFILDEIGSGHRDRSFAIIIDEAHSSQGGKAAGAMADALGEGDDEAGYETYEDRINREIERRTMLDNASYFAFTATPKNKTLELFGESDPQGDGTVRRLPFHTYSMKQAIQEGFILDVLEHYTPVESYYRLAKTVEEDPEYDVRKAGKKLRRYVEGHDHAIRLKAEIMVDHFHEQVIAQHRIGGRARAMVVTNGIERAIQYFHAIRDYLRQRRSPHEALVAFSGEHDFKGDRVTEASLNGLPSSKIAETFQVDPYRFLVCADKFQTGYDEPLLHTMYVDKTLSGIRAVQTLSRLNRSHPEKRDVFVLDFLNDTETIAKAFADYYRTTILSDETDPDRLHDLQAVLDGAQVYSPEEVRAFVKLYLDGAGRGRLDPILDRCVAVYMEDLDEDGQVRFKGRAKAFTRAYAFLSSILPYNNLGWEERSIFLNFLIPKLPAPEEEDLSKGILERIDMDSYRVEKHRMREIILEDEDAEIDPVQTGEGGGRGEIETGRLSAIIEEFNDLFGGIEWGDPDRVIRTATEDIPAAVARDARFKNARRNSDRENTRVESDKATERAVLDMIQDDTRLFQRFSDDSDFRRWVMRTAFRLAYEATG